ncbi:Afadin and alpha-actinin-binding-domain-containing protein, partial [Schizophyllum fasciatum]
MQTPAARTVRWDLDDALSGLNSPASNTSTEFASTSSLQYINSQLVAHGFTAAPGLSLDGVASADMEKAVKCLLAMLSQRVEDMARTETLSTKLRTLTYDHERLKSMHVAAEERAASAEREMHTYKSRLANAQKALQTSEAAHKHTTTELQRTRSSLQTLRTLHQTELKKKDKEIDRMADRWAKLADAQARLSAAPSGLRCANGGSVDAGMPAADSQTFLESALEESERARMEIVEECRYMKQLVLNAVGGMREVAGAKGDITLAALFPISPAHAAKDAIMDTLAALRATIARLSPSDDSSESPSSSTLKPPAAGPKPTVTTSHSTPTSTKPVPAIAEPIPATTNSAPADIARLQETIKALRTEIDVDYFSEGARSAGTAESHAAEAAVNHIAAEAPRSIVAEGRRRTRAAKGDTQKTPTSEPEREASPAGRQTHPNDDRKRATHAALE